MDEKRIDYLAHQLLTRKISATEREELDEWYNTFASYELNIYSALKKQQFSDNLYQQITKKIGITPRRRVMYYRYVGIAASLLLVLSIIFYRVFTSKQHRQTFANKSLIEIKPGSDRAQLRLADGRTLDLEKAAEGMLPTGDQSVKKAGKGLITYSDSEKIADGSDYNILSTPKGGKFSIKLSDGTLAILDASSSLRYPSRFTGANRMVEVSGQVYFEVVHNAKQPFIVRAAGQTIRDLGTHFNINAYPQEKGVKTTLEEGAVSVQDGKHTVFLKPGQAAWSNNNTGNITVVEADLEEVLSWKNGYFRFNDERIGNIMLQLSNWYDIEVSYAANLPEDGFNGTISRSKNLTEVLAMLERTGIIHFKIEGRRITVLP